MVKYLIFGLFSSAIRDSAFRGPTPFIYFKRVSFWSFSRFLWDPEILNWLAANIVVGKRSKDKLSSQL
jgi:hypothetical protein